MIPWRSRLSLLIPGVQDPHLAIVYYCLLWNKSLRDLVDFWLIPRSQHSVSFACEYANREIQGHGNIHPSFGHERGKLETKLEVRLPDVPAVHSSSSSALSKHRVNEQRNASSLGGSFTGSTAPASMGKQSD